MLKNIVFADKPEKDELKERLKTVSDINEKLKITNEIANIKKRMCE